MKLIIRSKRTKEFYGFFSSSKSDNHILINDYLNKRKVSVDNSNIYKMSASNITLTVQGTIDKIVTPASCDIYCKYTFACGPDWEAVLGSKAGITYTTRADSHQKALFNYPIGISLRAASPYGWPQIVVAVYGLNAFGNDKIVGYGAAHIPIKAGKHELRVPLFAPQAESFGQKITAFFTGLYPELIDSNFVAQGPNREVMKTHSGGYLTMTVNVVLSDIESAGYKN